MKRLWYSTLFFTVGIALVVLAVYAAITINLQFGFIFAFLAIASFSIVFLTPTALTKEDIIFLSESFDYAQTKATGVVISTGAVSVEPEFVFDSTMDDAFSTTPSYSGNPGEALSNFTSAGRITDTAGLINLVKSTNVDSDFMFTLGTVLANSNDKDVVLAILSNPNITKNDMITLSEIYAVPRALVANVLYGQSASIGVLAWIAHSYPSLRTAALNEIVDLKPNMAGKKASEVVSSIQ